VKIWNKLSARERVLGVVTCVAIVTALIYSFMLQDLFLQWGQLSNEIEMKERLLSKNLSLIEQADQINSRYQELSEYVSSESNESVAASQALGSIQALAGDEIEIENIKPLETKRYELSQVYEFELEGRASKEKLIRFLHKTANSGEALSIRAITLSSTRSGDELRYYMVISKLRLL